MSSIHQTTASSASSGSAPVSSKPGSHVKNLIAHFDALNTKQTSTRPLNTALKPLDYLTKYPEAELHRLVVDGRLLVEEGGWQAFEAREPGCLKDFFTALRFIRETISTPLSPRFICQVQALAGKSALTNSLQQPGEFYSPLGDAMLSFLAGGHSIEIGNNNCSVAGIKQFLDQIEREGHKYLGFLSCGEILVNQKNLPDLLKKYECKNTQEAAEKIYELAKTNPITIMLIQPEDMPVRVQSIIDSYYKAIAAAGTEEARLKVIVEHIQLLEQLHPFTDVNNRTFIGLILQKLLIENGFTPVTLWNYNIFDLYSRDEIIEKLKEGMNHTRNIMAGKAVMNFDSKTTTKENQELLAQFTSVLHGEETKKLLEEKSYRFAHIDLIQKTLENVEKKVEELDKVENKLLNGKTEILTPAMNKLGKAVTGGASKEERIALYKEIIASIEDAELRKICENHTQSLEEENFNIQRFFKEIRAEVEDKFLNKEFVESLESNMPVIGELVQELGDFVYKDGTLDRVKEILSTPDSPFAEIFAALSESLAQLEKARK